jgi:hypothetical protein
MLAVTEALALIVKVQVFVLLLPLEQAPDHTTSRPLDTFNVTEVPLANDAVPLVPVVTVIPAGVETTVSPPRPVADTVSVTFCPGGGGGGGGGGGAAGVTVAVAVTEVPLYVAVMVTVVVVATLAVVTVNPLAVVPSATVTLAGMLATPGLLLDNVTVAPPGGAPPDNETNAEVGFPPVTLDGLTVTLCRVTPAAAGVTVSGAVRVLPL